MTQLHLNLPEGFTAHTANLETMPAPTWFGISRLRQDVFVVEQECPYPDQDDRDLEASSLHFWVALRVGRSERIVATLRLLSEDGGSSLRIGRVATAVPERGRGIMTTLLREAIRHCRGRCIDLEAQAHLQSWYEGFGFARTGDQFLEDGIPHVPMCLRAR